MIELKTGQFDPAEVRTGAVTNVVLPHVLKTLGIEVGKPIPESITAESIVEAAVGQALRLTGADGGKG